MIIQNNSHRFSLYSKTDNSILDPNSFAYQSSRRQAYLQRLYYEFIYTQEIGGSTFFYTLTYNDKSIPKYHPFGSTILFPCFLYDDVRYVTNGQLSKVLERKYGSRLRYFCACETGEGKGSRGLGRNPHYHFIFFVQPIHVDGKPDLSSYKVITPLSFRRLIHKLWHGTTKPISYQDCKFGIAKEGDNCGLVTGIAPFKYVSKYCNKENNELNNEFLLRDYWKGYFRKCGIDLTALWYFYKYNSDLISEECHNLFYWLGLDKYNKWRKMTTDPDKSYFRFVSRYGDLDTKVHLTAVNDWFTDRYIPMMTKIKVSEYVRLYSGKVRCSKSLGEYGLNFIKHKDSAPVFIIPKNGALDYQTPCLYYYRKLYYDKFKCDYTGNVLYRLNELGRQMKVNSLSFAVRSVCDKVSESLSIVSNSHIDEEYYRGFSEFRNNHLLKALRSSDRFEHLLHSYACYKLVYQFRSYDVSDLIALDPMISFDSVLRDYSRFLELDCFFYDYDVGSIRQRLYFNRDMVSFACHPSFKNLIPLFGVIDRLLDCVSSFRSNNAKFVFAQNAQRAKRVNGDRFNSSN